MGRWIEGEDMDFEFDDDFPEITGQAVKTLNADIARRLANAYDETLQQKKKDYQNALNRTKKNLYQGRKRGEWAAFYKKVASGLFADKIHPKNVGNMRGDKLFDVKTGFRDVGGSGGGNLPELYYFGKSTGDPLQKKMYVKATVGNPVQYTLKRGIAYNQIKMMGGKYVLPEGYVSKGWRDNKKRFEQYGEAIKTGFERASKRVFSEVNR